MRNRNHNPAAGTRTLSHNSEFDAPNGTAWTKIWKLADYMQTPLLQNFTMSRIRNEYKGLDNIYPLIKPVYDGIPPGGALRAWITELYALGYTGPDMRSEKN